MLAASLSREAQQRDGGFGVHELARSLRGGDGDIRQLDRVRFDDHGAIGESHEPVVAHGAVLKRHDENAGHQPRLGVRTHTMQGGPHGFRRRAGGASDAAIGVACRDHQGSEIQRPARNSGRFHLRDALGAPALVVDRRVPGEQRGSGAFAGLVPISTGFTTPSRASRPAASSTRPSPPSGNTIVFFSLRARSMIPDMNSRADSGKAAMRLRISSLAGGAEGACARLCRDFGTHRSALRRP